MSNNQRTSNEGLNEQGPESKQLIFVKEPPGYSFPNAAPSKVQITQGRSIVPEIRDGHIWIPNSKVYTLIRDLVSSPESYERIDGNYWPTAIVEMEGAKGTVQIKPPIMDEVSFFAPEVIDEQAERMWRQVGELDEADADILEGLYAMWIHQARTPQEDAIGSREALLTLRGLKRKKAGNARRGGYSLNQLQDVSKRLGHLINFEVDLGDIEGYESQQGKPKKKRSRLSIKSRAVIISDIMGQRRLDGSIELDMFLFHPGRVIATYLLGPGYTTALLSIRALHYDPYRQRWEKRITRYLSWQWRIRASAGNWMQAFSVRTLLEKGCKVASTPRRNASQQERFEKMMDTITDHDDPYRPACGWQYDATSMHDSQGNLRPWVEWRVLIEPPDLIRSHYTGIQARGETFLGPAPQPRGLGELIQRTRLKRGLNNLQAAEEIGISPALLSMIQSGSRGKSPSKSTRAKIQKWLNQECA